MKKINDNKDSGNNSNKFTQIMCRNVGAWLDEIAPQHLSEKWDNVGWMAGKPDVQVTGILVCLDVTEHTLQIAIDEDVNLIVSHHPPFFLPLKTVTNDTSTGRIAGIAWKNGIQIFSAHTNYDKAENGLTDQFARLLDLQGIMSYPDAGMMDSYAKVGQLKKKYTEQEFIAYVIKKLELNGVRTIGSISNEIKRVVVQNGAYDRELLNALQQDKPDVLITGDVKYHDARELEASGIFTIDAGHFGTEAFFAGNLAERLSKQFPQIHIKTEYATDVYHSKS